MRLVSKTNLFLFLVVMFLAASFVSLGLSSKRADALSPSSAGITRNTQRQTLSLFTYSAQRQITYADAYQSAPPTTTPPVSDNVCDRNRVLSLPGVNTLCHLPIIENVANGASAVYDCVTSPIECMTDFAYTVIGGAISWGVDGVVSLIAGQREECMNSARDPGATNAQACETRMEMDYIPRGDEYAQANIKTQLAGAKQLMDRYSILAATSTDPALQKKYNQLFEETKASMAVIQSGGNSPGMNVFYIPKSPIASAKFDREYGKYGFIALSLMVPMLIAAAVQSVISGKPFLLFRSTAIMIPASIFGIAISPYLVRNLMVIIDGFSNYILKDTHSDVQGFFGSPVTGALTGVGMGASPFLIIPMLLVALLFLFSALLIFFILSMREASVAIVTIFLPIAFASSIWPALSKWALRAIKLLIAAIISKMFIVGVISLGISTVSSASGQSVGGNGLSFSQLIYGSTIFFIAAFSPHLVTKFFDEIGDALNAAGGTGAIGKSLGTMANAQAIRGMVGANGVGGLLGMRMGGGAGGGGGTGLGGGGGAGGSLPLLAGSMAGTDAINRGEDAAGVARAQVGATMGADGSHTQAAKSGADGAGRVAGANSMEALQGSYDGAAQSVGFAPGHANAHQAQTAAEAVGQAVLDNGGSAQQATAVTSDAANYFAGAGTPAATQASNAASTQVMRIGQAAHRDGARARRHATTAHVASGIAKGLISPAWGARHFINRRPRPT